MNLLALASEGSVAAADEFLPVLVYVIITVSFVTVSEIFGGGDST